MKKCLLSIVAVILTAVSAWAGAGFYGTGGFASGKWNNVISSGSTGTPRFFGVGFIADSAAAENTLINYRFKAGYERTFLKMENTTSTFEPIHRFGMSHTLGFGILRNEQIRFWIGPRFGLNYFQLKENVSLSSFDRFALYLANGENIDYLQASTMTVRRHFIGLDMLLAMGMNFNFGDHFTLFLDVGAGYMGNINVSNKKSLAAKCIGMEASAGIMFHVDNKYRSTENKTRETSID